MGLFMFEWLGNSYLTEIAKALPKRQPVIAEALIRDISTRSKYCVLLREDHWVLAQGLG